VYFSACSSIHSRAIRSRRIGSVHVALLREREQLAHRDVERRREREAERAALVQQRRHRDLPAAADLAEEVLLRHLHVVKKISLNSAWPVICRSGRTSTPGRFMSAITYVSPLYRGASGSPRPTRMQWSAMCANDDHTFWPLTRKWSPLSSMRGAHGREVAARAGSEKPWHQISSALRSSRGSATSAPRSPRP
jgi:hypothetical protein